MIKSEHRPQERWQLHFDFQIKFEEPDNSFDRLLTRAALILIFKNLYPQRMNRIFH